MNRMLEKTIKDYKDLAKAFEAQEWKDVQKIVQTKKSTFTQVRSATPIPIARADPLGRQLRTRAADPGVDPEAPHSDIAPDVLENSTLRFSAQGGTR